MRKLGIGLVALVVAIGGMAVGQTREASASTILQFYTVLHNSSHNDISNPIPAGISVHDYAFIMVSGAPPLAPSTVTFQRFATADCTGTAVSTEIVPLTLEGPGSAHAESSSFVTTAGSFSYLAAFNGDGSYPALTAACESFGSPGDQGCTPGYWKVLQHWDSWSAPWSPGGPLSAMFSGVLNAPYATWVVTFPGGATVLMGNATQVQGLQFQGGSTVPGKAEILLRAGVAAVLNADSPGVSFPWTSAQVQAAVNAALASQDETTIINLANELDEDNNAVGGCPLN
jgi:hypothetical protein